MRLLEWVVARWGRWATRRSEARLARATDELRAQVARGWAIQAEMDELLVAARVDDLDLDLEPIIEEHVRHRRLLEDVEAKLRDATG